MTINKPQGKMAAQNHFVHFFAPQFCMAVMFSWFSFTLHKMN